MPLDPMPTDPALCEVPPDTARRSTWRPFLDAVEEALPTTTLREDEVAWLAGLQIAADRGVDVEPSEATRALRMADAPTRRTLRDIGLATLYGSLSIASLRRSSVAVASDVRTIRQRRRRGPVARWKDRRRA